MRYRELEAAERLVTANSTQSPCGVQPDQRFVANKGLPQRGDSSGVSEVAQSDTYVALKSLALGPFNWTVAKAFSELLVIHLQQRQKFRSVEIVPFLKRSFGAFGRLPIHGTNILANVATENPIAHQWAKFTRDYAAKFDGQIRNALAVVQHIGRDYGAGWAVIYAPHAVATGLFEGDVLP